MMSKRDIRSIEDEIEEAEDLEEEPIEEIKIPLWRRILEADSSPKPLGEFMNHPLNFDQSSSTARIIKGLEGIVGNLDKAIVDVVIGVIQKVYEWISKPKEIPA